MLNCFLVNNFMARKYSRWKRYFVMNSLEVNNQHADEWKHGSGCFVHAQDADRMLTVLCFQPQCSSVNWSSEDDYGKCQLIILVSRWPVPIHFLENDPTAHACKSWTIIRASFLLFTWTGWTAQSLPGTRVEVETNYQWRHIEHHTSIPPHTPTPTPLSLPVRVCVSSHFLPGDLNCFMDSCTFPPRSQMWRQIHLPVSLWRLWYISGGTYVNWCHHHLQKCLFY